MRIAFYVFGVCVAAVWFLISLGPLVLVPLCLLFAASVSLETVWLRFGALAYIALFQIPFWIALFILVQLPPEGVSSWSAGSNGRPSRTFISDGLYTVHGRQLIFSSLLIGFVIYLTGDLFRLWQRDGAATRS